MKHILLILLLLSVGGAKAQMTVFAPPGSEWYHNNQCGVIYSHYVKDTVIGGIDCREVVRNTHAPNSCGPGYYVYDLPTLYFYNTADTVFIYNYFFNGFTPLYVFNVSDGDTVTLPVLPTETGFLAFYRADSTFQFIVDSVRTVLYDTAYLKTVYTRSIGDAFWGTAYVYSYGSNNESGYTIGRYAEKIGNVSSGLIPECVTCGYIDEYDVFQDSLRCYSDSTLAVKLVADSCDTPYGQAAVPVLTKKTISFFPNPANDNIYVNTAGYNCTNIQIINSTGITEINTNAVLNGTNSVNIAALPDGVYVLKIFTDEHEILYKKFSVLH